ncbi:MAG: substrate-binding periplasmic protein, partial [Spirochaetota bacterium]
ENYIAPQAGVKIQWLGPYPFSRAMSMLEDGEADAIQHLSRTADREAKFIFSTKPIMWGRQGLVVQKDEKITSISSVSQLKDKKIAMIGDGYLAPFYQKNRKKIQLEEVYGENAGRQIVKMVLARRVWGAYFTFPDVLLYYAATEKKLNDLKVISFPGSDTDEITFAAFSRRLNPAMVKRLDDAITAVSRTYNYPEMTRRLFTEVNK